MCQYYFCSERRVVSISNSTLSTPFSLSACRMRTLLPLLLYMTCTQHTQTYEEVCRGHTGHTEAVQLHFDPQVVTYSELLTVFWDRINPTTLNKQGNDVGTQYRSGTDLVFLIPCSLFSAYILSHSCALSLMIALSPRSYILDDVHVMYLPFASTVYRLPTYTPPCVHSVYMYHVSCICICIHVHMVPHTHTHILRILEQYIYEL